MRAFRLHQPQGPVVLDETDIPSPGPGEVLVKMEACGLCHSDLFIQSLPQLPLTPLTLGHEGVGIVEKLGDGVSRWAVGDRVGLTYLYGSCGECELCQTGRQELCAGQQNRGYHVNGAFAEYALARENFAVRVPKELDAAEAAPLCCAGWTALRAVKEAGLAEGQWLAVHGAGGLGQLAIQLAKRQGLRTVAVDVADAQLEAAARAGADLTVNAASEDVRKALKPIGGAHAAACFAASAQAAQQAAKSLRRGGSLVLVGLAMETLELPLVDVVIKGLRVQGSFLGRQADLDELFAMAAAGDVRAQVSPIAFDELPEALAKMAAGTLPGRVAVRFSS